MTEKEIMTFKELFAKYCNEEIKKGHCQADGCDGCPINEAHMEIFDSLDQDEEDKEE